MLPPQDRAPGAMPTAAAARVYGLAPTQGPTSSLMCMVRAAWKITPGGQKQLCRDTPQSVWRRSGARTRAQIH